MPNPFEQEINQITRKAIADGVNNAADIALMDIKTHVQVLTGRLRDSYRILRRATPENPAIEIDSSVEYKKHHYPPIPKRIPRERNRALQGNPLWGTDPNDTAKYDAMVQEQVEQAIDRALF